MRREIFAYTEMFFRIYTNIFSHIRKFSPLRTSGNIPAQGVLYECVIVGISLPIRSRFFTPIFKALEVAFYPQMRVAKWLPRGEDFPRRAGPRPWERAEALLFALLPHSERGRSCRK